MSLDDIISALDFEFLFDDFIEQFRNKNKLPIPIKNLLKYKKKYPSLFWGEKVKGKLLLAYDRKNLVLQVDENIKKSRKTVQQFERGLLAMNKNLVIIQKANRNGIKKLHLNT